MGFVREIQRRVRVNREGLIKVAWQCGQSEQAFEAIVRILEHCHGCPSDERVACIAMNDPTLTDEDIGDILGRTSRWAAQVRAHREEFEEAEPIPDDLCWFVGHITKSDPLPDEIRARCAEVRAKALVIADGPNLRQPAIRQLLGRLTNGALVFRGVG